MKPESHATAPAFYVPEYCHRAGLTVIPVPVLFPDATTVLGLAAYRSLADIPGPVDLVDVFRRPADLPAHLGDLLAKRPRAVWLQSGIRHEEVAERLLEEGIDVVQDRCLMVELQRLGR